ncbi:hypothetical protein [Streptoalloteichus hindustanus]|nr:hypothetical protein [Streptoalloteichus hindustanus]
MRRRSALPVVLGLLVLALLGVGVSVEALALAEPAGSGVASEVDPTGRGNKVPVERGVAHRRVTPRSEPGVGSDRTVRPLDEWFRCRRETRTVPASNVFGEWWPEERSVVALQVFRN